MRKKPSRQLRWQRRHRALGLCAYCSRPADSKAGRCAWHYLTQLDAIARYLTRRAGP